MWHSNNLLEFLFVCAEKLKEVFSMKHELPLTYSTPLGPGDEILCNCTRNAYSFHYWAFGDNANVHMGLKSFFLAYSYRSDVTIGYKDIS